MQQHLRTIGWTACIVYATIPSFWLMIHPRVDYWRSRSGSPYRILLPIWIAMWIVMGAMTFTWRHSSLYSNAWTWLPASVLFGAGLWIYKSSVKGFSGPQLSGTPEIIAGHVEQRLVTTGIRARIRHPVYLAHLCEMLAWSLGTGLVACYALTVFALISGAVMIRSEDRELEHRLGPEYVVYREQVPALIPRFGPRSQNSR